MTIGIVPTEYKVLIAPKEVETVSKGGIIRPVDSVEKDKFATVEGEIVAVSPLAFTYASQAEWDAANARKPGPGDRVIYAKYAGIRHTGRDGKEYLLINDKDVVAIIEE